jgi:hypothetical protein
MSNPPKMVIKNYVEIPIEIFLERLRDMGMFTIYVKMVTIMKNLIRDGINNQYKSI